MKTWEQLNAELTAELEKENPDKNKLFELHGLMLKTIEVIEESKSPNEIYFIAAKCILFGFVLSLIALAIFT